VLEDLVDHRHRHEVHLERIDSGTSTRSFWLSAGKITVLIPAR
jgi:hypothetical protein